MVKSNVSEDSAIVTECEEDDDDSTLLVNYATADKFNTGYTMKLLSAPSKGAFTPSSTKIFLINQRLTSMVKSTEKLENVLCISYPK